MPEDVFRPLEHYLEFKWKQFIPVPSSLEHSYLQILPIEQC